MGLGRAKGLGRREPILGFWLRQPKAVVFGLVALMQMSAGALNESLKMFGIQVYVLSSLLNITWVESLPTLGFLPVSKKRMFLKLLVPSGVCVAVAAFIGAFWLPVHGYGRMFRSSRPLVCLQSCIYF